MILPLLLFSNIAFASIYSEIPKTFDKYNTHTKQIKLGYNLTNNLMQKQTLFFVEGNVINNYINHSSRYQFSQSTTTEQNSVIASNETNLFRTNNILPFYNFTKNESPYTISGIIYGRYFHFDDNLNNINSIKYRLLTAGFGFSKSNTYTIGISAGHRSSSQLVLQQNIKTREAVLRPSLVYSNTMQNVVPKFLKNLLRKNNIFDFSKSSTTFKLEYALVSSRNTNIEQFYIGFEKKITERISVSIFYDNEKIHSKNPFLVDLSNNVERFSTSLVFII